MHYVESGDGPAMVFLHGNPTSSYLWRDVTSVVAPAGYRCIAVDLVGMGRSGVSSSGYRLVDHIAQVGEFIDELGLSDVILVGHDWGAVIALALARSDPGRVRGVAVMEGHLRPIDRWDDMDDGARALFSALRTAGVGEGMVFVDNVMIETVLPSGILRTLSPEEMDAYRRPFVNPDSREPMLRWTREIPIAGEPSDVVSIVTSNQQVFADATMPTLLMHGTPGAVVGRAEVAWCRNHGRAMTIVDVGSGTHFLPEDQPAATADALLGWATDVSGTS
ncbi:haloalkane dehalogenase [Rhodococcus sp. IEGM 1330]|uniref:haloalkane dehalogenase n=1 Tax=Rhodococcus sp. IEGM 1330 TaxID=3082225 RepID=UPI002954BBBC|nr:haloalkane dehalogenase [Rhodococcus sp. IEGM 1330]MDV8020259.1 haloalkane dehalogenase [Rhodococcus sp. IEGM 1330]